MKSEAVIAFTLPDGTNFPSARQIALQIRKAAVQILAEYGGVDLIEYTYIENGTVATREEMNA